MWIQTAIKLPRNQDNSAVIFYYKKYLYFYINGGGKKNTDILDLDSNEITDRPL